MNLQLTMATAAAPTTREKKARLVMMIRSYVRSEYRLNIYHTLIHCDDDGLDVSVYRIIRSRSSSYE